MASPQKVLDMIRAGDGAGIGGARIEIDVDSTAGALGWVNIYEDETISIGGSGDELIITANVGNIEYTAPDDQGAPYTVSGIRIELTSDLEIIFPETTFTDIEVEGGSTLRFTEIKLTLT